MLEHQPNTAKINPPFSNMQLALLQLYSQDISDQDLQEIKRLIGQYFAQKAIAAADKVWEEKEWTEENMNQFAQTRMRATKK